MHPLGLTIYFSVYKQRPAYGEITIQAECIIKNRNFSSPCAFKLHTYQSCLNTVGIRKRPLLLRAWGLKLPERR